MKQILNNIDKLCKTYEGKIKLLEVLVEEQKTLIDILKRKKWK